MKARQLQMDIGWIIDAHDDHARKESKRFRKVDGKTSYAIHPIACAALLLHEQAIPEADRYAGAQALIYHDLLEDTTAELPSWLNERVRALVSAMTFKSSDAEMEEVWERAAEVRMLKLFDKVSNLLDGGWMSEEKRRKYQNYTRRLATDVETHYGNLNIVKIAKAICG